jgi:selenocysteine-specific translation elongation factor
MRVIGTAGHVDHGKSTLVLALTGIDPDRLREEKERQMTIDLGFAWLTLPGGELVGVVDVPGHIDFIKNMLAGVGGIDAALFVVAADEGAELARVVAVLRLDMDHLRAQIRQENAGGRRRQHMAQIGDANPFQGSRHGNVLPGLCA